MKKAIISFVFALVSTVGFSQFQSVQVEKATEIGKVKIGPVDIANISYRVLDTDTIYYFKYKDGNFTE